jgi:hypothetical protein
MSKLAGYYDRLGDSGRAAKMGEECWRTRKAKLGADHPHTLTSMSKLAGYYDRLGDSGRAAKMGEECLRTRDQPSVNRANSPALPRSDTNRDCKKDGKRAAKTRLSLLDRISRWRI